MKLVKSLLLGSAAGLAAMTGAQAADLPTKKAVAVEYVRVCTTYGNGYFVIPGTDTCMRISGYVQADYLFVEQESDAFDDIGFRARIRLNVDVRQPTEFGLLRAFARMDFRRQSGPFTGGDPAAGSLENRFGAADQAYIQWGGLTAGRAQSFFDFYTYDDIFTTQITASDTKTQLLAYTFSFGGGLSGTISLEDAAERRIFGAPFGVPAGFAGVVVPAGTAPFFAPSATAPGVVNAFVAEGVEWPDVVANLRWDQPWGSFQLSGAIHDLSAVNTFVPFGAPAGTIASRADNEIGFAVQAGAMFKLPFIAPGDELWLQATYSDGAGHYNGLGGGGHVNIARLTNITTPYGDAFVDQFGNLQTPEVFSVSGKFKHYWAPNLRSNFFGGYTSVEFDGNAAAVVFPTVGATATNGVLVGFPDFNIWEVGANLIWTPVKQLDIGVEAVYRKIEVDGGNFLSAFGGQTFNAAGASVLPAAAARGRLGDDDVFEARLRIQRDF